MVDYKDKLIFSDENEERKFVDILNKSLLEYSSLIELYTIDSLTSNPLIMLRIVKDVTAELGRRISIETRLNSLYKEALNENTNLSSIILEFRRRIMNSVIQIDKCGYLREDNDISQIIDFVDIKKYALGGLKSSLTTIVHETVKNYINDIFRMKESIIDELSNISLTDVIDMYGMYQDVPEFVEMYSLLFSETTIIDILDLETDIRKLWNDGCSKETYLITKVGLDELYKREMLDMD